MDSGSIVLGQLRNEISKRAVASSCDAATDEELAAGAKNGDELGFESLAKRHRCASALISALGQYRRSVLHVEVEEIRRKETKL